MAKKPAVTPAEGDGNVVVAEAVEAVEEAQEAVEHAEATGDEAAEEAAASAIAEAVTSVKDIEKWLTKNRERLEAAGEATPGLQAQLGQFQNTLTSLNRRLDTLEATVTTKPKEPETTLTPDEPAPTPAPVTPARKGADDPPAPKTPVAAGAKKYRVI